MNDYDFLWNGQHTRCAETVITVNGYGEVTSSCNPDYVPNDTEFKVCRNLGIIENGTDPVLVEKAKFDMKEGNYSEIVKRRLSA